MGERPLGARAPAFAIALLALACIAPPTGRDAADVVVYDPATDALVNPPSLYEPFPVSEPERAARDTTIVRHDFSQPGSLNPLFPSGAPSSWTQFVLLFEFLVIRHTDPTAYTWNSNVVLAAEPSADLLSVTLDLNPEVRWHDGEPWTAHDIVFSLGVLHDERVPLNYWGTTRDLVATAEALGDHRVRIVYSDLLAPQLRMETLVFPVVPEHVLGQPEERAADPTLRSSSYYNRYARETLVGSGPYRLVEWLNNDRVVLERWEDHFLFERARPAAERMIFKFQSDRNLAFLQFLSGEYDQIYADANIFATQANGPRFAGGVKARQPAAAVVNILWNLDGSNPFFGDPLVRKALAHAYDAETVLRRVGHGLYERSYGYMVGERFDYEPRVLEAAYRYDLELAGRLLDEAGWQPDEEEGWRYKEIDGQKTKFSFELSYNPGMTYAPTTLDILRDDFRRLGVEMVTRAYEGASLTDKRLRHEFQALLTFGGTSNDPHALRNQLTTAAYDGGLNGGGYSNPRVDELFALGVKEQDAEVRAGIYREIHRLVYRDQPSLFLFHITFLWIFGDDIRGVELGPQGTVLLWPTPPEGWPSHVGPGWWRESG